MRAVITDVDFLADKLQVRFDVYLEIGEPHYEDYVVDGEDTPCNTHFVKVTPTSTLNDLQKIMLSHLSKVKSSWEYLDEKQSDWVGIEVQDKIEKKAETKKI